MHPNKKPRTFDNFRDFGHKMNRQEPTPQEQNNAQLFNWLMEIKQQVQKISDDLRDYRMKQADERLYMRDFINGIMKDRKSAEEMLTLILDHLTRPYSPPINNSQPHAVAPWSKIPPTKPIPDAVDIDKMLADEENPPVRKVHRFKNTNLEDFIFNGMCPGDQYTADALFAILQLSEQNPGVKKSSIAATLSRLYNDGKIERVCRGVYKKRIKNEPDSRIN